MELAEGARPGHLIVDMVIHEKFMRKREKKTVASEVGATPDAAESVAA